MSIDNIQVTGNAVVEIDEEGKKSILLTIDSTDCVLYSDNVGLVIILNGITLGSWK